MYSSLFLLPSYRESNAVGKVHVLLEVDWRRRRHFAFGDFGEALRFEKGNMEDRMDARELGRKLQAISDARHLLYDTEGSEVLLFRVGLVVRMFFELR